MSELFAFVVMGFHHLADLTGLDHVLFLLALAAIYRGSDWRAAVWVVTAFTVGHSITLAMAVTGALAIPTSVVEFLIPATIVATGLENLLVRDRGAASFRRHYRPVLAGVFGLVHGAGFANYLRGLFTGSVAVPLFGFNIGLELGQLLILAASAAAFSGVDHLVGHRARVTAVSGAVLVAATGMAVQRLPW